MSAPSGYTALDFVGFTDKGTYNPLATYMRNDLVHYGGNIWKCLVDNTTGITPVEGANWTLWIGTSANLAERTIAPLLNNPADAAFGVGRQVIYDDWLWEVIAPIAIGDTLIDYAVDPTNANIKKSNPVETQLLAVKAEADATDNMIAPTETNASSSSAVYAVGDQLILNNILYTVTAPVTIGDALVSGTGGNIEASDNLTDQLASKANSSALATVATSGSYADLSNKPTLGTAAAKNSTNAVTQSSTDLVESGAVYSEVDSVKQALTTKADKSGTTFTGDISVQKTATGYTNASVTAIQNNSDTGENVANLVANQEGGNLRLAKGNNTAHLELDTQPMNGSSGYARLYLGDSSLEDAKTFKFKEDGSFEDGNGVNTKTLSAKLSEGETVSLNDFITIDSSATLTSSSIKKVGNHIYAHLSFSGSLTTGGDGRKLIGSIKPAYRPSELQAVSCMINISDTANVYAHKGVWLHTNGNVQVIGEPNTTYGSASYPWTGTTGVFCFDYWL